MTEKNPSQRELFFIFLQISIAAFGGVLPWARRVFVEKRRLLTAGEFNELLALCQLLPGPNIGNFAIVVGRRFHGWRGAVAAALGLLGVPFIMVLCLGALYTRFSQLQAMHRALDAMAAVAAGMMIAMAIQTARTTFAAEKIKTLKAPVLQGGLFVLIASLAFISVALFNQSLPLTLVTLLPAVLLVAIVPKRLS